MRIKKYLAGILAVVLLGGCNEAVGEVGEKMPEQFVLQIEEYQPILKLAGNLAATQETLVSTKASGRISDLRVGGGDRVFAGQILGELSAEESKISLRTASNDNQNARISYSAQKRLLDEQVISAEKAVATAEAALRGSESSASGTASTTDEQISLAEKSVQQAENALESVEQIAEQRWTSFYSGAKSTMRGAMLVAGSLLTFSDNLLEVDENLDNSYYDQYKNYFGAKDSQTLIDARDSAIIFSRAINNFSEIYDSKIKSGDLSNEEWVIQMIEVEQILELAQILVEDIYRVLSASSTNNTLTDTVLQNLKTQILTLGGQVEAAILSSSDGVKVGVRGWLMTKSEIETQNTAEISAAEKQLLIAEQALNQTRAATSQGVTGANSQVNILEEQLAQTKSGLASARALRESTLRQLERGLSASSGNLQLAGALLENTKIVAPFEGVIVAKLAEKGQVVGAGQPVFQISNDDLFKLEADVPDTKIAKLKIGLPAKITLDGIGGEYSAVLTKIDPSVDVVTRKLGIELSLSEIPPGARVGQFARAELSLSSEPAFFVPREFVRSDFDGQYILLDDGSRISIFTGVERDDEIKIWWSEIAAGKILEL